MFLGAKLLNKERASEKFLQKEDKNNRTTKSTDNEMEIQKNGKKVCNIK